MKKILLTFFTASLLLTGSLAPNTLQAADPNSFEKGSGHTFSIIDGINPECRIQGNCDFCDFLDLIEIIARFLWGISGTFAFLVIVNGGFGIMLSKGNSEELEKNKKAIGAAILGFIFILISWQFINAVFFILTQPLPNVKGAPHPTTYKSTTATVFPDSFNVKWTGFCSSHRRCVSSHSENKRCGVNKICRNKKCIDYPTNNKVPKS